MEEKRGARELNGEGFGMRRVVIFYSRFAESQKEKKQQSGN